MQIQDLLAFLEPLGSVTKEADDPLDRFFHAVKFSEARIPPDRPVHEDAPKPLIMRCVDDLRLAYRRQQPLRGAIGGAAWRDGVGRYVEISVVAVPIKKKILA